MKRVFLVLVFFALSKMHAQLPPVAQALYNEFYNSNTVVAQYCLNNGAQAVATADGNSFYLKWFPPAVSTPSTSPLMVALHGSGSNAFNIFYFWHQKCLLRGVGIITLQWYRGAASVAPNDYFDDNTLYTYIDTALKRIKYPSNKALFNGFSRGSARSYAIQFKDVQPGGKNYFCTILSNAGKPDSLYPLYQSINTGTNHTFCTGKRWAMYCGGMDPNPSSDGCPGMNSAKNNWVIAKGGTVGLFIQAPTLGHSGLTDTPAYMDSVLKFYLPCFTSVSINEYEKEYSFRLFPNPTETYLNVDTENYIGESIQVYDYVGVLRKELKINNKKSTIDVSDLPKGIYFLKINMGKIKFIKE